MALAKVLGYNVLVALGGKKIAGTTSDTFTLAGKGEETIMKSDKGKKQIDNIGHDGTFSVNAFVMKGTVTGWLNFADVVSCCAGSSGSSFVMTFGGTPVASGFAIFRNFTLNSDSENYADCSIELQTQGSVWVAS